MKKNLVIIIMLAIANMLNAQQYPDIADLFAKSYINYETCNCELFALDEEFAKIETSNSEVVEIDYSSYTYYVNFGQTTKNNYYLVFKESNFNVLKVKPMDNSLPNELINWRKLENQTDTIFPIDFCSFFSESNMDTILVFINSFLTEIPSHLGDTQKIEMTAAFLRQFNCLDSVVVQGVNNVIPWMPGTSPIMSEIVVYWEEQGIQKHMVFDIVMKKLLYCDDYHRNYEKQTVITKFTGEIKFENLCNIFDSLGLEVDYMYNSTYYSDYECDTLAAWLYDSLRAIPYINHGVWNLTPSSCYCHSQTKQIMFFPRFYFVLDKNVQADWIRVKQKFRLSESGGYWVRFKVPEGQEIYWTQRFKTYPFVQYSELNGLHHN